MLEREKVVAALEQKRAKFQDFSTTQKTQQQSLEQRTAQFLSYDYTAMTTRLEQLNIAWPGAHPTPELDRASRLRLAFPPRWANHREARNWALAVLLKRPVLAVDGSQITPSKDFSLPVGAVQIGWFINEHRPGGGYVKDVLFEVLAPDELTSDEETVDRPDNSFPNQSVNQLRFVRECEKLCELMQHYANAPEQQKPLCYFDGSFIISFAGHMLPRHARPYLQAVQALLACSEQTRVPLVGFVDNSFSRDIVTLIENLLELSNPIPKTDAGLLKEYLLNWGDRSPFFECARTDALTQNGRAPFYADVVFSYVHLANDRPPARLEMPRWLLEAGRADDIVDLVRAECVVGANGYPYAIETADAVAVISQEDRQRFYTLFQRWGEDRGLQVTQARKALSKLGRR
ncbi:MAG: DNA double-strand break repair nuclease NurA [Caldilineaceae bacterium]